MAVDFVNETDERVSSLSFDYRIFELLKHPVSIIGTDGLVIYANKAYRERFDSACNDIRLDSHHPFFPEYRKRIAQSYLAALHGSEKRCFAVLNSQDGNRLPVEMYIFPMFRGDSVHSILALMIIVEDRLLSFDQSTLSIISDENYQYDNLLFEYSPMPIVRINEDLQITKCSLSLKGFLGYDAEEILDERSVKFETIFTPDADKIKKAAYCIFSGERTFYRMGEVRISTRDHEKKIANLTMYPIIRNGGISAVEIIMEDITKIKDLVSKVNTGNLLSLFTDITKGFLHTLSNSVNVILSKTHLLLQNAEEGPLSDGILVVERSALDIAAQVKRIQNFIGRSRETGEEKTEPLADIIEDAIEFSKMKFKVFNIDNTKNIRVEKNYFSQVHVHTDTRLLREIITSIILKVSGSIQKAGVIDITLKQNNNLQLIVEVGNAPVAGAPPSSPPFVNIFSGIDIHQAADILNMKIIEEESTESFAIMTIFPARMLIDKEKKDLVSADFRLSNLDIIIVEDDMQLQKILFELFDGMGNRVFNCDDGRKAIEEFKKNKYDMVITDYGIPGITGIELAARIKEINENVITVLLSGWTLDNIQKYKKVADIFLQKPFKLEDLLAKISKILSEKKN
jgi:PAS domain S-box-containing protein